MKCLIFLASVTLATATAPSQNDCKGVIINGINHKKEILKENLDKPYQLTIDQQNNVLYFSYSSDDANVFSMAYMKLKNNEFGTISGVTKGKASAVDKHTHSVFLGGQDGIYKLDSESKRASNLRVTDNNIWQMFSNDGIYFTTYPDEQAYLYKNDKVSKVTEIGNNRAMLMGVDKNHNIIFYNSSGIFYYTKNDRITSDLGDHIVLNGITSDVNGKIFLSSPSGIYTFDEQKKEVKKLVPIIDVYGVAIESDGSIIYASENSIIRLKPTGKKCATE